MASYIGLHKLLMSYHTKFPMCLIDPEDIMWNLDRTLSKHYQVFGDV